MENTTTTPSDTVTAVSWVSYMLHFVVAVAAVIPGVHAVRVPNLVEICLNGE